VPASAKGASGPRRLITRRGLLAGLLLVVAALLVPGRSADANELRGRVVAVGDGDDITMLTDRWQRVRVRLAEIDAPERRQAFGDRARQILSQLVFERRVVLRVDGTDRNRRVIAHVFVGRQHVNAEMVRRGAAWVFPRHSGDPALLRLQREAEAARRGLWALPERQQVPPWEWRARRRRRR
jgi:endonuclease YncB( thermonuclease family)